MADFDFCHLIQASSELQRAWDAEGIRYCFIGGLAVLHWGEVRMTQDVDATVLTGFGNESSVINQLLRQLRPRIDNVAQFAKLNRVLLVQTSSGVPVDISLSGLPYEEDVIDRSQLQQYDNDHSLRICDASDLVILKAFANRERDWQDIRGILIRSPNFLDWHLIDEQLGTLADLKEEPEILAKLKTLQSQISN